MLVSFSLSEDYWEDFELQEEDIEFLYNYLLEVETPLTSQELVIALVNERIQQAMQEFEQKRTRHGDMYVPQEIHTVNQELVFPVMGWKRGKVTAIRPGKNPDLGQFQVIKVAFADGDQREFASQLADHKLNEPPTIDTSDPSINPQQVMDRYSEGLMMVLEENLETTPGFVRIAGRWFPRSLLMEINIGQLNLAEAVLDMVGGGPLRTAAILEQIDLPENLNPKLVDFSFDLALQEDPRFDEVGPAGETLWFLNRLEPAEVLQPPLFLRYAGIEYDRSLLNEEMLELESDLDDELSPVSKFVTDSDDVEVRLIFPHWQSGTLPLSSRLRHLFPTAYEAPRIRFMLVDGLSDEKFPGWVVREKRYIYGLKEWYESQNLIPGSIINVKRGEKPGEVIVSAESRRSTRDWIRTVLVGSDGGLVFAMLKQHVTGRFDDRMAVAIPDPTALNAVWEAAQKEQIPLERVVVNSVRELARLNPQSHVHASELYAAINVTRRCPPGPILALLASRPWFVHVGDMHFRFTDSENI